MTLARFCRLLATVRAAGHGCGGKAESAGRRWPSKKTRSAPIFGDIEAAVRRLAWRQVVLA